VGECALHDRGLSACLVDVGFLQGSGKSFGGQTVPGREAIWEAISKPSPARGARYTGWLYVGEVSGCLTLRVEAVEDCRGELKVGCFNSVARANSWRGPVWQLLKSHVSLHQHQTSPVPRFEALRCQQQSLAWLPRVYGAFSCDMRLAAYRRRRCMT
jgi:hypothetical protein